ncbi:hypothetical protein OWP16_04580 [Bacillus paranthracis]|uniref:hypothetical protein n=1 Tax=Bacillus paranthracis TaxID=2026186 RepID=UPI00254B2567|nr:hypothetical protein [Bacillus paranthracis]MDK7419262.1 hypothetical protein [Bacillus paranthracis]MDK7430873.1 hypothetical protein [Bacillus paranthracis]MDK7516562.1 hypothetical protein [Bacillus paranthracis]MDK7572396.1 hypothetical protein [Bacillus paranthracis]
MNYIEELIGNDDLKKLKVKGKCKMKKLRERYEDIQLERQEIEKAFDVIRDMPIGDSKSYKDILKQFDSVKLILFYTRNNKWLIMEYLAKHDDINSLAQLVSTLLGYQGQDAIDNNDEALEDKLHIECCIWKSVILRAKNGLKCHA